MIVRRWDIVGISGRADIRLTRNAGNLDSDDKLLVIEGTGGCVYINKAQALCLIEALREGAELL